MRFGGVGITLAVLTVGLTACAPTGPVGGPETTSPPTLTVSDTFTGQLPPGSTLLRTISLDTAPVALDDALVGTLLPDNEGGSSELTIVGFQGEDDTWALGTNPACGMFALTHTRDGSPLVVAINSDASVENGTLAQHTTASAFDARDGAPTWADVEVPGPLTSTSLVFSRVAASVVQEPPLPQHTLDPDTGADFTPADRDFSRDAVVHEHAGVAVLQGREDAQDGQLTAQLIGEAAPKWRTEEAFGAVSQSSHGHALLVHEGEPGTPLALLHTRTGERLGVYDRVHQAVSSASGSFTALTGVDEAGETTLTLIDETGARWSTPLTGDTPRITAVSDGAVFLEHRGDVRVLDAEDATELTRGAFAAPVAITTNGVAVLPANDEQLYGVIQLAEPYY